MKRVLILMSILIGILLTVAALRAEQVTAARQIVVPTALVTFKGSLSGKVGALAVKDQSGIVDTPAKYVTFITPGTIYQGYQHFILPAGASAINVSAMQVTVNYKGLPKVSQRWLWSLYNWTTKKWVYIGDNTGAKNGTWFSATFSVSAPRQYVNAAREVLLLIQSANASGDAKIDFEGINVTYGTPTPKPTATKTATPTPAGQSLSVYDDSIKNGWGDWSWGGVARNPANTTPVHAGTHSMAVTFSADGWDGLQFGRNDAFPIGSYDIFRFWIHGGTTGGQKIQVSLSDGTTKLTKDITPSAGTWIQVNMSTAGLSQVTKIAWFNNTDGAQATFYVDDAAFIATGAPTATPSKTPTPSAGPALSVDVSSGRHTISPYIYGINFAKEALASDIDLPVRRWGGNSTTRYNWQTNIQNTGSDWYFENVPADVSADQFIDQNIRTKTDTLMTVPLIGWTPRTSSPTDHPFDCGFKVSRYGGQKYTDPYDSDCGNGIAAGGANITGNDPIDTSMAISPAWVTAWINHFKTSFGAAGSGGVAFYNLDNEPMLWNSTHRDVHPNPTTYDEMKTRTYAYAAAIKAADPNAKTLGPVVWGWCAYFYSAADGCEAGSEHAKYGDFIPWYLTQMKAYENTNGTRILDYLDIHMYPQGDGIFSDSAGNAATQALRLRSTRALWDASYIDESWINQAVNTIPRMHAWANTYYPGTKLAISEYSWGAMGDLNGALAQADVLGIFGREGLDLATLWGPPTATQPGAYAFRIYRNYDGSHSKFGETGVSAASADQARLSIYAAQRASDSAVTVVIINKTGGGLTSTLSLAGFSPSANAQVYRYSAANLNTIQHLADLSVTASGFTASYPANSITLLVIPGG